VDEIDYGSQDNSVSSNRDEHNWDENTPEWARVNVPHALDSSGEAGCLGVYQRSRLTINGDKSEITDHSQPQIGATAAEP
jgi:hypothetical protein